MKIHFFLFVIFLSTQSDAAILKDLPGSIPLQYERQAASDLIYKGKKLLPDEARALYDSGEVKDLSLLDPIGDSIIWKNETNAFPLNDRAVLNIQEDEEMDFLSTTAVPNGRVGFIAQKKRSDGSVRTYQVLLDLKGHNILLRRSLLRKIGYNVPAVDHLQRLTLKFKGAFSKNEFVREIQKKTFIEPERWVTSNLKSEDDYLTLQDLIIFEGPDDQLYNLARGNISENIIQGRRLFNSLLLPFSLTDAPESINLMSWSGGQIFNDQFYLPYEYAEGFSTSYEDARWMARRLLKLTRADWQDIALQAGLPNEAALVLVEKMISRRNLIRDNLKLNQEFSELPIQLGINSGERLKSGKLIGPIWPGYARHFAGVDPDSPLSSSEIFGLFKSRAISNGIANLLIEFNSRFMPQTDIGFKIFDHQLDVAAHQFAHFIATGEVKKTPFGFWSSKLFNANIIASRDIVAGNYLGTENIVQMADTIGLASNVGIFYMGEGLPVNIGLSGQAKITFMRTYTHIKPVQSIKASLKEPFRNMMVPLLKKDAMNPLQKILDLEKSRNILDPEKLEEEIKAALAEFNKLFGAGESLIVSTSVGPDVDLRVSKGLAAQVEVYGSVEDKLTALYRAHIYHKDEKTVQVYMDPALFNIFSLAMGFRAHIPVLEIGWDWKKGMVQTAFFEFNLNPKLDENPDLFDEVSAVMAALNGASEKFLSSEKKPWRIDHDFSDKDVRAQLLFWRFLHVNSTDVIRVTHPEGAVADFVRRTKGQRTGRDFESLLTDVTNALISDRWPSSNAQVSNPKANNPADTFLGKSVSREVTVEAELTASSLHWDKVFSSVNYRWKGWQIKREQLDKILDKVKGLFGVDLFQRVDLNNTKKVQFYAVDVSISLYQKALVYILNLKDQDVSDLFRYYSRFSSNQNDNQNHEGWTYAMTRDLGKARDAMKSGDRMEIVKRLVSVMEVAENQLTFEGFKVFVGGQDNLFVKGTIRGFRVGAESGNQDVQSISIGQIGSNEPRGPLANIQGQMGISGGEFFISWLLNPL